ncbi:MAG TPA: hypothetical protein VN253_09510 [Kofleriaceae bacterium]|nr:hypothetical protein [Kofleriaceae bacterium]
MGTLLIVVAGCSFSGPGGGASNPDGMVGDGADGAPTCTSWSPIARHVVPCDLPVTPGPAWMVTSNSTFDTTDGSVSGGNPPPSTVVNQGSGVSLRVISVGSFEVAPGATLRVIGSQPLLVLSWSTIQVAGIIEVGSIRAGATVEKGAGADRSGCSAAGNGTGNSNGGGGGGGGYRLGGGAGGNGSNGSPGVGGGSISAPMDVYGGCAGGRGAGGGGAGGAGGSSGGAIQLTAKTSITIASTGRINAGGAGGRGAQSNGGGGGGGSGGFIGLDAPMVTVESNAVLAANGGGGGTGCKSQSGPDGSNGSLVITRAPGGPAAVCMGPTAGGGGGAFVTSGSSMEMQGEVGGSSSNDSGAGGGGGVGYILAWASAGMLQFQGTSSPALQQP